MNIFSLTVQYQIFIGLNIHRAKNFIFVIGPMPCICKCGMLVNGGQWKPNEASSISTPCVANKFRSSLSISSTITKKEIRGEDYIKIVIK